MNNKVLNNRAWLLVLPMLVLVAFSAIIPLMTVVNYSVQDVLGPNARFFTGTEWFHSILNDSALRDAFVRQILFSLTILAIQVPLGIGIALIMPKRGWQASAVLILITLPLLIPWNVVGSIWQIFTRGDIGLMGWGLRELGINYNITRNAGDA
ncbi:MAG: sugar ABC transporter permease, partial [Pseudomonadota bacterium]|nr:sugar ABC transporter permease [Pseudomonadota bacterium]